MKLLQFNSNMKIGHMKKTRMITGECVSVDCFYNFGA